jgi:uncharacterized protein YgbK (DUF1537 family)
MAEPVGDGGTPRPSPPGQGLRAAFYGDDVTGSTDALAEFQRAGLRSLLLFGRPDPRELPALAREYDVIGVAGVARSLPAERMAEEVEPVLTELKAAGPRLVQYKMCSTADSSPQVGSLGRAIEIGRAVFGPATVPVLAAQPEFGRYTAFGHHFAADAGIVHRLDRQPTMSRHPVTPMTEADLRLHIGRQTTLPVGSLDLTAYELPTAEAHRRYRRLLADGGLGAVVVDAVTQRHLRHAGELILGGAGGEQLYALGSGGLSHGVAAHLAAASPDAPPPDAVPPATGPVLAVSGSCSPRTAEQIRWALDHGWQGVPLDVDPATTPDAPDALARLRDRVRRALDTSPAGAVVYTALGPPATPTAARPNPLAAIGTALAHAVTEAVAHAGVRRVIVAGGDTAGQVIRVLGVHSAEIVVRLGPGTALCRLGARPGAPPGPLDGVQILLKGGQAGAVGLFGQLRGSNAGTPRAPRPTGASS